MKLGEKMKWFKHDSDSRHDAKIQKIRLKYGMEGYGLYFFLLECIAGTVDSHNLTFELEEDAELISNATNIHIERVEEMMRYMVNLGLFESDDGRITCLKMALRTDEYTQQLIRKEKSLPRVSRETPDSLPINSQLIEEKRTDKKRDSRFAPPSVTEVAEYVKEKKYSINAQQFVDFYSAKGWMVGKNKMRDWKAAVRTWANRDGNKQQTTEMWVGGI
jgi:hypothetical protein